jgi:uncharacterized protein YuzE
MKTFKYDPSVDSIYILIQEKNVLDSEEIAEGIIVDYDTNNNIVGLELLGVKTIKPQDLMLLNSLLQPDELGKIQELFYQLNPYAKIIPV